MLKNKALMNVCVSTLDSSKQHLIYSDEVDGCGFVAIWYNKHIQIETIVNYMSINTRMIKYEQGTLRKAIDNGLLIR